MSAADAQHETDDRFPTGQWTGFYLQPDSRRRHVMNCYLEFAQDSISGEGDDAIGEFSISGAYSVKTARCSWSKQYIGQHSVQYAGQARQRGIVGQWTIEGTPEFWSGPFFLWPRAFGDLESAFEKAFVEYELSEPLVSATALPMWGSGVSE